MSRKKTLDLESVLKPDMLASGIANKYVEWEGFRQGKMSQWQEIQQYIFATDTKQTSNSKLPWKNTVHIPKLCQIRDNLHANYMATLFPKRKWLTWEGGDQEAETREKKFAIEGYMQWAHERSGFYDVMNTIVLDYIDYGNCFVMPYWKDDRVLGKDGKESEGYVGPGIARISPLDIVFDPTATDFRHTPKIIRSFKSMGEAKLLLQELSLDEESRTAAEDLWKYMQEIRAIAQSYNGPMQTRQDAYNVAGFGSYSDYLASGNVEILTFYGDLYDEDSDTLLQNHIIKVVDRHKVLVKGPNDSAFGFAPIFHAGWRIRPDNLWAMGPLDNLVGIQYRIDHLENLKNDIMDVIAFPMVKRKGYVEDFNYGPLEEIIVGDDGDVEFMSPNVQALNFDTQIQYYENKMEEMAGAPREAMGIRSPGEKTKYEVQRLELAGGRIFQSKTAWFEQSISEPLSNSELELARRNVDKVTIRSFDTEFKIAIFTSLTNQDITGNGFLVPFAARHFAEQANRVQNLNAFLSSPAGTDPQVLVHFSGERLARLWEELLELEDSKVVENYVRINEQAEAQRMTQAAQSQLAMEAQTPTGIYPGDHDPEVENEATPPVGPTPQGPIPQG